MVVPSSGNVFAGLELNDAKEKEKQTKVRLALAINPILPARKPSQIPGACAAHSSAEDFRSGQYKPEGFSVERRMHF